MDWISLELKLISCRDLKAFNFFQKLSVYVVVSIFNDELKIKDKQKQQCQKTEVDREGGGHPEWNQSMQFDLKDSSLSNHGDNLFLKFELRCDGAVFRKRTIGEVKVPFKDLIDEFNGNIRFVSYQIRNSDGKPNGVLHFSYKMIGKANKKNGIVDSPSGFHFSPKKNQSPPSAETQREKCLYPSLDDIRSPSPQLIYYPTQEFYAKPPPQLQLPALAVANGVYYQSYPSPFVQAPGAYWYTAETTGYGQGFR